MATVTADVFSHGHIAVTAALTGVLSLVLGLVVLRGRTRLPLAFATAAVSGFTVYLWRASADVPQLNHDGIGGLSANDWLAPVLVYVALGVTAAVLPGTLRTGFSRLRAVVVVIAFAVNVITI